MLTRRRLLLTGAALGCSAAASPWLTPIVLADAPWQSRLVVIVLRGAMDGLDAVQPVGDPAFAGLRPTLAAGDAALPLDGFYAMHPALAPLMPLWRKGELGFVHAVSTPYRDKRSHFDGQDILEAGVAGLGTGVRDGWLNRLLQTTPGMAAETAYAVGVDEMLILTGKAPYLHWAPQTRLDLSAQAQRLLGVLYQNDPPFRAAADEAVRIAQDIAMSDGDTDAAMPGPDGADGTGMSAMAPPPARAPAVADHVQLAQFAAARLRGTTRIASFSLSGWDSHVGQSGVMKRMLGKLAETILALKAGLGDDWARTGVICLTEFGRTAYENGTRGTDHGTGGVMVYAGGALKGGQVAGSWPGLAEAQLYESRDLMSTRDVRAHAGWIMRGLFGVETGVIDRVIFPGVDLGTDPRLVL
ncbi:MAG: DUF1501 domain-containing protein [Limimaricola sp.]|uniref:DUF1501 domain-containing protein n=1 Tax=Limimaricola sp. TaxID=2211665 RepID=UPI001DD8BD40|nr:DUF1501 domain-containing protein [Limimaricola sp.]MBI1415842.1 DUF1501 domain-containing protein [Limimaricola sp.]